MLVNEFFIAIDGPNGVGKSTIIDLLRKQTSGISTAPIVFTKEPTTSTLGEFIRKNQGEFRGEALAALVAANRYEHIDTVVRPNVKADKLVISDRYFASSLVYQILDDVTQEFVLKVNRDIMLPKLYFILTASAEEIWQRLKTRNTLTRFERRDTIQEEIDLFVRAKGYLMEQGVDVRLIDNNSLRTQVNVADEIANAVMEHLRSKKSA